MKDKTIITNRFSLGNPIPLFFAGRQLELFSLCELIIQHQNLYEYYGLGRSQFIVGEPGVGKTSVLLRLRQQIMQASEFYNWIPVHICVSDILKQPDEFGKIFVQEIEKSIISIPHRREIATQYFTSPGNQKNIAQISPKFMSVIQNTTSGKTLSLSPFFRQLREDFQSPTTFFELIMIFNMMAHKCNFFILWTIDHFEKLKKIPEFFDLIMSVIAYLTKRQKRFYLFLAIDSEDYQDFSQEIPTALDEFSSRLGVEYDAIIIREERNLARYADYVKQSLCQENYIIPVIVNSNLNLDNIITNFVNRVQMEFLTIESRCPDQPQFAMYLPNFIQEILGKIEQKAAGLGLVGFFLPETLKQFTVEGKQDGTIIREFAQFLTLLDRYLENFGVRLAIIWKDFEKFVFSTGRVIKSSLVTRRIAMDSNFETADNYSLPTSAFMIFYSTLTGLHNKLKNISLVTCFSLPETRMPEEQYLPPSSLQELPPYYISPLPEKESRQLLQEVSNRCGLALSDAITENIYEQTKGNPLLLQYYGYFLVESLQNSFEQNEIEMLKQRLLKYFDQSIDEGNHRLLKGLDNRMRWIVDEDFYSDNISFPPEKLFETISFQYISHMAREIIAIVVNHPEESIEISRLLKMIHQQHFELTEAELGDIIEELSRAGFVIHEGNNINIIHRHIAQYLRKILNRKVQIELPKNNATTTIVNPSLSMLETSAANKILEITQEINADSEKTHRISNDDKEKSLHVLQDALAWLKSGYFPSGELLGTLSLHISFREDSSIFPVTMCYIYVLCSHILEKLESKENVEQTVTKFKEFLKTHKQNTGTFDLTSGIEKILEEKQPSNAYCKTRLFLFYYYLHLDFENIETAVDSYARTILEKEKGFRLIELGKELETILSKRPELKDLEACRSLVRETLKILMIEKLEDEHSIKRELLKLTPEKVGQNFHHYLVEYLENLICYDTAITVKEAAIQMIGVYGHIAANRSSSYEILDEIIHRASSPFSKLIAARSLCNFIPFVEERQRNEITELLKERITVESNSEVREGLVKILANIEPTRGVQDFVEYLWTIMQTEQKEMMNADIWHLVASSCAVNNEEISKQVLEYYQAVLQCSNASNIADCSDKFLMAIKNQPEILEQAIQFVLENLEQEVRSAQWNNAVNVLPVFFPDMTSDQKESVALLIGNWLAEDDLSKRVMAYRLFFLIYPYAENIEPLIECILMDSSSPELQAMQENFERWIIHLPQKIRNTTIEKMLSNLQNFILLKHTDSFRSTVECLAQISFILTESQLKILLTNIYQGLTSDQLQLSLASMKALPTIWPYIDEENQYKLQKNSYDSFVKHHKDIYCWKFFLKILSVSTSFIDEVYCEAFFHKLYEHVNLYPEQLLKGAFEFFGGIYQKLSESLSEKLTKDALYYLSFYQFSESALIFLLKNNIAIPNLSRYAYRYQFYNQTLHLALGLCEIMPEIADTPKLSENYEYILQKLPYFYIFRMADFLFHAGAREKAFEWANWSLRRSRLNHIKIKSHRMIQKWNMIEGKSKEVKEILQELHENTFSM